MICRYTTATERALDVIGNAEEVYRNTVQHVDITAEQMVAKVKLANGATFNTVRGTNSVINAGTRFKIDSDVEVQFLDSVQLLPREKEIYFSALIHKSIKGWGLNSQRKTDGSSDYIQ